MVLSIGLLSDFCQKFTPELISLEERDSLYPEEEEYSTHCPVDLLSVQSQLFATSYFSITPWKCFATVQAFTFAVTQGYPNTLRMA